MMKVVETGAVDLVLLDIGLPGEDGLALAASLRDKPDTAVIMITGRGAVVDRVVGLELGADDYVAKPFDMRELLARVRSVLRRTKTPVVLGGMKHGFLRFGDWRLDLLQRKLTGAGDREVALTTAEFVLLEAFLRHPLQVLTRDRLLDLMAGRQWEPYDRAVDVQVGRLRRKIESDPSDPALIKTVRGAGYMFTAEVSDR